MTRMAPVHALGWILTALTLGAGSVAAWAQGPNPPAAGPLQLPQRLFYYPTNLLVDKNVAELEVLLGRAAKAGYTGVVLADSKFGRLGDMGPEYFKNIARVKAAAAAAGLEVIPSVFPLGWSDSLLGHDPNLIEGLPVRDALFVVQAGAARVQADPPVQLRGGDFEDLSRWDWKDNCVVADHGSAKVVDSQGKNARLVQKLQVSPYRQYRISVEVKTADFRGTPEIKVLTKDAREGLCYISLDAKRTQDWTACQVVFNSLDNREVSVYLGCWGGGTGVMWWRRARIEEAGLLNVLRRAATPVTVKTEDGKLLAEGVDYQRIEDPDLGAHPWKGEYDYQHQPPAIKLLRPMPDGTRLRVSYEHAITTDAGKAMICPSEPKTVELLRDQARRMHAAWGAKGYFMEHDEIRVLNQCSACRSRGLSAGAILADNVRTCTQILKEVNPGGRIYVWSDMFDPNHNAHADYYLVRGDLAGSWEGLDKDVVIVLWYYQKRQESMKFFADRGNPMLLAGYYDAPPDNVAGQVRGWLDAARAVAPRQVLGMMYTTWQHNYSQLESFAKAIAPNP